jgi:HSP20 family molecular chaperone IbpA
MAESTIPTHTGDGASAPSDEHEATRSEERFVPPPVDICEDEQGLVVVADLPGVEPGAVDVRVERRVLTIQARAQQFASGHPSLRAFIDSSSCLKRSMCRKSVPHCATGC